MIVPEEVRDLEAYGVAKIYTPEHGTRLGLQGIINHLLECIDYPTPDVIDHDVSNLAPEKKGSIARIITMAEIGAES